MAGKMEKSDSMSYLGSSPEGDTYLGQLFVKDQLTGMGIRKTDSASKLSALLGQPTGPDAKFDQQTGKYYKSFTIPGTRFEGVEVVSLLQLFSQPGLCYDPISNTGTIVSLAAQSGVHITVVGESHVEANGLFHAARARTEVFLAGALPPTAVNEPGAAVGVGGITLIGESSGAQEKIEELVPEHVAGISLFANGGKVQDTMTMDSCAGFALLSFADDMSEEEEECVSEGTDEVSVVAQSAAGFTLFNEMPGTERPIEELTAEHCTGISLFSRAEKPCDVMTADFVGGMMLLNYAEDDVEGVSEEAEEAEEATVCAESAAGFTLFNEMPGTERPIKELTAEHCNGISFFSRTEKPCDVMTADCVGGMTLLSYADDDLSEGDTATASCSDLEDDEEPLSNKDVVDLWNVMTNCAGLTLFGHKRVEEEVTFHTAETV